MIQEILTRKGRILLAAVCDGMGGYEEGETASGFAAEELTAWLYGEIVTLLQEKEREGMWKRSWYRCFYQINRKLNLYAKKKDIFLGTTATVLFLYKRRYHLFHIGDSRAYHARPSLFPSRRFFSLTKDHISRNHLLSRCIGADRCDMPDYVTGRLRARSGREGFLLCSDGLYRRITQQELADALRPGDFKGAEEKQIKRRLRELAGRAYERGETDNISAVYIVV